MSDDDFPPFSGQALEDLAGDPDADHECMGCGCTDRSGCDGGCFWTYRFSIDHPLGIQHPLANQGLCSQCAAIPIDELMLKIRIRHESILFAHLQRTGSIR